MNKAVKTVADLCAVLMMVLGAAVYPANRFGELPKAPDPYVYVRTSGTVILVAILLYLGGQSIEASPKVAISHFTVSTGLMLIAVIMSDETDVRLPFIVTGVVSAILAAAVTVLSKRTSTQHSKQLSVHPSEPTDRLQPRYRPVASRVRNSLCILLLWILGIGVALLMCVGGAIGAALGSASEFATVGMSGIAGCFTLLMGRYASSRSAVTARAFYAAGAVTPLLSAIVWGANGTEIMLLLGMFVPSSLLVLSVDETAKTPEAPLE